MTADESPQQQWPAMVDVLGRGLLAELVGVSPSSLHRYRTGQRPTPGRVAARLHFLAVVTSDLNGSYNDFGVRRWFRRSRSALGGRSPTDLLSGDWDPEDEGAREVRELAASLHAPAAS